MYNSTKEQIKRRNALLMSTINEKTKDKDKKKNGMGLALKRLALFLFIVILIVSVAIYAFFDINPVEAFSEGISKGMDQIYNMVVSKSKSELVQKIKLIATYNTDSPVHMAVVSGNLAVADKSSVRIYDSDGLEKAYIPLSLNKPFVKSYKKNLLVADVNGRYIAVISEGRILWQKNLDEDIVSADISDNWLLIVTRSKEAGYKRTIRAWTIDGQEVAYRNISNYYPVSAWYYPEFVKSAFIVSGVDVSGLETSGFFDILDLSMHQKASIRGDNEVVARGVPFNGKLMLYGEKSVVVIDEQFSTVWEKRFEEPAIMAAGVISGKYPVVAYIDMGVLNRENRYITNIEILNPDFSVKESLTVDSLVSAISSYGKTAALTAGQEVLFIDQNGRITDTYTSRNEINDICFVGEDTCYVMSGGIIERVKVNTGSKILGIF